MLWPSAQTVTGEVITPERALRQPTALACTRIITETVAQLPLHVYTRTTSGAVERDRTSPLHRMFAKRPNDWTTAYDFKLHMQADVILHGSAYALIMRDGTQSPRYLRQIPARAMTVTYDPMTDEPSYRVALNGGGSKVYGYRDILHLKALHGLSVISQCREAIAMALAQEKELNTALAKGQRPSGVLAFENAMTDAAIERAAAQWKTLGAEKGTAIIDGAARYLPVAVTNVDAQFLEQRRHQIAEIARAFRVPLHMLQELERVTHQNAEQLGRQFLQFTMLPHLTMWTHEINLKLMPADGSAYAEFLTDDLARADLAARMEAFAKAVTTGILSPNEVRQMENRAPYAGGDTFLRPLNMEGADSETR
ncbi:phage portal protein [Yoonia sp. SDW83-1]|uniref:phage portal protein n=1 Tax=Yoonia sp. SDW83-1 TaxID=3366945 RepID=UPI00398C3312